MIPRNPWGLRATRHNRVDVSGNKKLWLVLGTLDQLAEEVIAEKLKIVGGLIHEMVNSLSLERAFIKNIMEQQLLAREEAEKGGRWYEFLGMGENGCLRN